jgi:hypothetical protein
MSKSSESPNSSTIELFPPSPNLTTIECYLPNAVLGSTSSNPGTPQQQNSIQYVRFQEAASELSLLFQELKDEMELLLTAAQTHRAELESLYSTSQTIEGLWERPLVRNQSFRTLQAGTKPALSLLPSVDATMEPSYTIQTLKNEAELLLAKIQGLGNAVEQLCSMIQMPQNLLGGTAIDFGPST